MWHWFGRSTHTKICASWCHAVLGFEIGFLYPTGNYNLDYANHTAELTFQYQESTSNYYGIENIVVPETINYGGETFTVTSIGPWALNRVQAKTITLPKSIERIDKESVARVPNVKSIVVPEGVTWMGHNVFMGSDMERIIFPNSLNEIPRGTCAEMNNLKFVSIGAGVQEIGGEAFNYTNNIDTVVCRAVVPPVFNETWYGAFTSSVYNRATLLVPEESLWNYQNADYWSSFSKIYSIKAGEEGGNIGSEVGGEEIWIEIPAIDSPLKYIYNDEDLTAEVTFDVQESEDNYNDLEQINLPARISHNGKTYTVTTIGPWAFNRVRAGKITLPGSIRKIHKESMARIPNLEELNIPEGVETILDNAFMGSDIKRLYLPDSLIELAYGACAEMNKLKYITLGKKLETIGGEAFNFTNDIDTIECRASLPPSLMRGRGVTFTDNILENAVLLVPSEDLQAYRNHPEWGKFRHICPIETKIIAERELPQYDGKVLIDGLYYILYPAERRATVTYELYQDEHNYKDPQTIIIPPTVIFDGIQYTVDTVGASAFDRCYNATYISIPPTVTVIERDGFCSNRSLEEVVIGNNVTSIGYGAFAWNYSLKTLTIGSGVKTIGGEAFNGASELSKITIYATEPPLLESWGNFDSSTYSNATLYVPHGCGDKYRNADGWSRFDNIVEINTLRVEIEGVWYDLDFDTKTASVSYEELNSPDNYFNLSYLSVPGEVRYDNEEFKVVEVANHALANAVIKGLSLPEGILRIGIGAFASLKNEIGKVVLPESVIEVDNNAFAGARIKQLIFNEGIKTIGYEAGARMNFLKNISIGSTLESIGDNAFINSDNVEEIVIYAEIPPVVSSSESRLFSDKVYENGVLRVPAEAIEAYMSANGWKYFYKILPIKPLPERLLVDGIYYLLDREEMTATVDYELLDKEDNYIALSEATIRSVVSKDDESFNVTGIGEKAFANASGLTWASIPSSVISIGSGAFLDTPAVEYITCTSTTPPALDLDNGPVFSSLTTSTATLYVPKASLNLYKRAKGWSDFYDIRPIGTVKIGSIYYKIDPATHTAVTTYQEYQSSANYQYMKAAIVPETFMWAGEEYTVVGIGESSFDRCYDITHFDIPNTVTVIEKDGFCSNHSLKHVVIGENVTEIGYGAFAFNYNLETLTIGESVKTVGGEAFNYDSKLMEITCLAEVPPTMEWGRSSTFSQVAYDNAILYVPAGCVSAYRNSDWGKFRNIREIEKKTEEVEDATYIFDEENKEVKITYELYNNLANYRSILDLILEGIIKRVVNLLPTKAEEDGSYTLTVIGEHAFNHSPLRSVVIPNTVRSIERLAFANLENLETIDIPESVKTIGDNAFSFNSILESVKIGDGVESIGYGAFANNPELRVVELGSGVKHLGGEVFAGSENIETITLKAVEPPVIDEGNVAPFSLTTYRDATLFVPDEAVDSYRNAEGWKLFGKIKPITQSGIENILIKDNSSDSFGSISEDTLIKVFTTDGVKVYEGRKGGYVPSAGLYIIVSDEGNVKVRF
ncbi:MAG: leucine-rich repeat domain-containing protein [Muribaculaceae bacterium]|nr:leucine-rich repeat domain-containing protein [Muribaculaceae bacterium]